MESMEGNVPKKNALIVIAPFKLLCEAAAKLRMGVRVIQGSNTVIKPNAIDWVFLGYFLILFKNFVKGINFEIPNFFLKIFLWVNSNNATTNKLTPIIKAVIFPRIDDHSLILLPKKPSNPPIAMYEIPLAKLYNHIPLFPMDLSSVSLEQTRGPHIKIQ